LTRCNQSAPQSIMTRVPPCWTSKELCRWCRAERIAIPPRVPRKVSLNGRIRLLCIKSWAKYPITLSGSRLASPAILEPGPLGLRLFFEHIGRDRATLDEVVKMFGGRLQGLWPRPVCPRTADEVAAPAKPFRPVPQHLQRDVGTEGTYSINSSPRKQRRRYGETQRLRCLEIDHDLERGGLLHWQVAGL